MSSPRSERSPRILVIDAGGTMTDTIIIDADGQSVVGKAQTTPEDESIGFLNSFDDAVRYWQAGAAGRQATRAERGGRGRGRRAAVRGPPPELGRRPDSRQGLLAGELTP